MGARQRSDPGKSAISGSDERVWLESDPRCTAYPTRPTRGRILRPRSVEKRSAICLILTDILPTRTVGETRTRPSGVLSNPKIAARAACNKTPTDLAETLFMLPCPHRGALRMLSSVGFGHAGDSGARSRFGIRSGFRDICRGHRRLGHLEGDDGSAVAGIARVRMKLPMVDCAGHSRSGFSLRAAWVG